MAAPINFALSERNLDTGGVLLSVEGATTSAAGERLRRRVHEIIASGRRTVIIDLSSVSFIESGFVRAIGDCAVTAKKRSGRVLVVEPVDPTIARPLEMGGLDLRAEIVPTLAAAAKAMRMAPPSLESPLKAS